MSRDAVSLDPQIELYDRFVKRGEQPDPFSAKRLYPGLNTADALERIERLAAETMREATRLAAASPAPAEEQA